SDKRANALWGRGSRGETRSNALWGRGGRRSGAAVAVLVVAACSLASTVTDDEIAQIEATLGIVDPVCDPILSSCTATGTP
ncbi:MAG: hypothetical protein ACXVRE_09070, partial [Gaiellaceae bacterium]